LIVVSKWGSYRASDADRDGVIERLRKAATEGRIAAEELEQRVHTALKARTYDELYATVEDLPGSGSQPRSHNGFAPVRRSATGWAISAVRANPLLLLVAIPVLAVTAAMLLAFTMVWVVLMIVVLMLGGRPRMVGRGPWPSAGRRGLGPRRRGPGGHRV
jgi:hypothetical protein